MMERRVISVVLSLMLCLCASAQKAPQSLICSFTQTQHNAMMARDVVSEGMMYYTQPAKLRWEYTKPTNNLFILNADKAYMGTPGSINVVDVNGNKMLRQLSTMIMGSLTGSALTDDKTFDTGSSTEGNITVYTLVPKKKDVARMWSSIVMHYDNKMESVVKIVLNEKDGAFTAIDFSDIKLNCAVDPQVFEQK